MLSMIRGRVWIFGDNVDTDVITPSIYVDKPMEEMKKHVLEALNPRFPAEAEPGDVIVAGRNFGCGSSRETAPDAIKALGISAVAAGSFGRIFFRNAIAIGLPIVTCHGAAGLFKAGEEAELDVEKALVMHIASGEFLVGESLADDILEILRAGGILAMLKAQLK